MPFRSLNNSMSVSKHRCNCCWNRTVAKPTSNNGKTVSAVLKTPGNVSSAQFREWTDISAIGHTLIQTKNKVMASVELKSICQWATSARLTYLSGSSNILCSDCSTITAWCIPNDTQHTEHPTISRSRTPKNFVKYDQPLCFIYSQNKSIGLGRDGP